MLPTLSAGALAVEGAVGEAVSMTVGVAVDVLQPIPIQRPQLRAYAVA